MSELRPLKFKNSWYRFYAPKLYSCIRAYAACKLKKWQLDSQWLDKLSNVYWDEFLQFRMQTESKYYSCPNFQTWEAPTKNSERAYIFGCGTSINQLTKSDFDVISKHFSVGVNLFFVHDFVPTMHFVEFTGSPKFTRFMKRRLLSEKVIKPVPVLVAQSYLINRPEVLFSDCHHKPVFYPTTPIKIDSPSLLMQVCQRFYKGHNKNKMLCHQISNLDAAINLCVNLGYKDIRLVGVDLNQENYFFDEIDGENDQEARDIIVELDMVEQPKDSNNKHPTASDEVANKLGNMSILDFLPMLQQHVLNDLGVELSVCNPESLLAGKLPVKTVE